MFTQLVPVEELGSAEAAPLGLLMPFPQFFELVGLGGDIDLAGPLELAVDGVAGHGRLDGVEVARAQFLQLPDLVRPALQAVGQPVGEGGGAESAVATRGGPARLVPLDQYDIAFRFAFLGEQRGPQSAVASPDDEEVAVLVPGECGKRLGPAGIVQPERHRFRVGE